MSTEEKDVEKKTNLYANLNCSSIDNRELSQESLGDIYSLFLETREKKRRKLE